MTNGEAIHRIQTHMRVHKMGQYPHVLIKEALDMSIDALREQEERRRIPASEPPKDEQPMDVRGKLVELISGSLCRHIHKSCKLAENIADDLIANGVMVQELGGCEYCNEDSEGYRKMIGTFSITNPFHGNVWNIETCHCKPRQIYFCPMCGRRLSQPPKGE